jgi:hypothetical protein
VSSLLSLKCYAKRWLKWRVGCVRTVKMTFIRSGLYFFIKTRCRSLAHFTRPRDCDYLINPTNPSVRVPQRQISLTSHRIKRNRTKSLVGALGKGCVALGRTNAASIAHLISFNLVSLRIKTDLPGSACAERNSGLPF